LYHLLTPIYPSSTLHPLCSATILWCELMMSSTLDSPVGLLMTAYNYQTSSSVMVQVGVILIGVVSVVSQYNCVYYCDTYLLMTAYNYQTSSSVMVQVGVICIV
jgi:hypothetical protein